MSRPTPPVPTPPGVTLDALRREAKRWLKLLRAGDAGARARLAAALPHDAPAGAPTLRQAQHALAREHGYAGWGALADAVAGAGVLPRYERVALALARAYNDGDRAALRVVWDHFGHMRALDGFRRYVRLDLGRHETPDDPAADVVSPDEARALVARAQGFASWEALGAHAAAVPADSPTALTRAVALHDAGDRDPLFSRDWDEALAVLRERRLPALRAHGQMTDAVLARAARLGHLTHLDLSGSRALTDDGVRHLARLRGLRHLDLSGTGVTDAGLAALRGLPALETLSLAWTAVGDAGAGHLAACPRLRDVNLMGTPGGDGTLRAFDGHAALRELRTGNGVTDAGLAALHGIPAFRGWLGGEERLELTGRGVRPNALTLRGTFTDAGMRALAGLDGLYALDVDDARLGLGAAAARALAALPRLQWLAFDADDASLPALGALPHLRFLICQDTTASDDGFAALARSRTLEYLWGRRCHGLGARGFRALATMPALRALSVSCLNVPDDALAALPDFPALRELMPIDVPDAGYRHVARCAALESLILMYCRETGDEATAHVARLPALRSYFASYTRATDRTPELLASIATLESVTFDSVAALTDAGVRALARLPRLRTLSLSGMPGVTAAVREGFPASVAVRREV
ncbi:hypothetical protein [Roseisolibacter sp. H3M3-2]|uniref:hypothetical protein n=1 Tax=Roseisolibacter sp. H3M3-2 TaxID=3031323 RepID=UPI0023DC2AE7|nr:hypothetical protein [Roseisolibacter sp. H3M3-2]MDF1502480.1 hypothetical protein [Roseisolibacter sp. H3M3-2]